MIREYLEDVEQVQEAIAQALEPIKGMALTPKLMREVRYLLMDTLQQMELIQQWVPEVYAVRPFVRRSPTDPTIMQVSCIRDTEKLPWTEESFLESFRKAPLDDDLERINCQAVGEPGHKMCGQCPWCFYPRWQCECKD